MVYSKAKTVDLYLKELPREKADVISALRKVILKNLPRGYQETMNWGMISYEVPLDILPETYNKQPLMYLGLVAQKNYFALHCLCVYMNPKRQEWLRGEFAKAGKKLDMGKGCLRFKKQEDIPINVVKEIASMMPMKEYVAHYQQMVESRK